MSDTIKLILSLSLSGSLLAGSLFAIKPLIKHRFSKTFQYYIWIVVLLRLLFPFSFEESIMNQVFYSEHTSLANNLQDTVIPKEVTINSNKSSILPNVKYNVANGIYNGDVDHRKYFWDLINLYFIYIWLIGVMISFAVNLIGYTRFLKYIRQADKPAQIQERKILNKLLNGRNVRLVRNSCVSSPMLIGFMRPTIIIPDTYFSESQLKNILLHEIIHLKRSDILVKWLTLITVSVHWFNPLMYLIKKEINHACELACDEAVIKNFKSFQKQAYGETLIAVVTETKLTKGILQATMNEEKNTLKERLVAIMQYHKKSKKAMVLSAGLFVIVLFGALYLGAGVGKGFGIDTEVPPKIYISAENEITKEAIIGSYEWKNLGVITIADSVHPLNFKYQPDNIVSLSAQQQLIITTQKRNIDKKYEFSINQVEVYKDGKLIKDGPAKQSFLNGNLYLQGPKEPGEYIYVLRLDFKDRGTVNYGFVVRVGVLTYDLSDIARYKTSYVGKSSQVSVIANRLPLLDKYFKQQYISMQTKDKPYSLTVYYEAANNVQYNGVWPVDRNDYAMETNLSKNALVLFCMIDNLDEVTFAFRNSQSDGKLDKSKYTSNINYQRSSFEAKYGDLTKLGSNLLALQNILARESNK